jgi:signal transduction histidine kinase/CheY-like chemotaxis protein
MLIPVIVDNTTEALIILGNPEGDYTEEELESSMQIGTIFALGLKNIKNEKQKRLLQDQLFHAQKMEAIGTFAGGIAHDFNNILTAIMGYTQLAEDQIPEHSPAYEDLKKVLKASQRAKDLIKQLLTFSRKGEETSSPIDVVPLFKESIKMIKTFIPSNIKISQKLNIHTCTVKINPVQFQQVIMNLSTNGFHAMKEKGGTLELGMKLTSFHSAPKHSTYDIDIGFRDLRPGNYLCMWVRDSGKGISPEALPRIFDPYFTTKEKFEGTGLGLSVVHGIIKDAGGAIGVKSTPEQGSLFEVYLPVATEAISHNTLRPQEIPSGKESILIVDDDPDITELYKRILQRHGYMVKTATSGKTALKMIKEQSYGFDLVITDMDMPDIGGMELIKRINELNPEIPIMILTGFGKGINHDLLNNSQVKSILIKPVLESELAFKIKEVLGLKHGKNNAEGSTKHSHPGG